MNRDSRIPSQPGLPSNGWPRLRRSVSFAPIFSVGACQIFDDHQQGLSRGFSEPGASVASMHRRQSCATHDGGSQFPSRSDPAYLAFTAPRVTNSTSGPDHSGKTRRRRWPLCGRPYFNCGLGRLRARRAVCLRMTVPERIIGKNSLRAAVTMNPSRTPRGSFILVIRLNGRRRLTSLPRGLRAAEAM